MCFLSTSTLRLRQTVMKSWKSMAPSPSMSHALIIYSQSTDLKCGLLLAKLLSDISFNCSKVNVPVLLLSSLRNSCCSSSVSSFDMLSPETKANTILWNWFSSPYLTRFFLMLVCRAKSSSSLSRDFSSCSYMYSAIQGCSNSSLIDGLSL